MSVSAPPETVWIEYLCPAGHRLREPAEREGSEVPCTVCGLMTIVPDRATLERARQRRPFRRTRRSSVPAPAVRRRLVTARASSAGSPPAPPSAEEEWDRTAGRPQRSHIARIDAPPRARRPKPAKLDAAPPDPRFVARAFHLSNVLWLVILLAAMPALFPPHLLPLTAPAWARVLLVVAAVQAIYVAWMRATPDWASLTVVTIVFGASSGMFAAGAAMALAATSGSRVLLDIGPVRDYAAGWCAFGMVAMFAAAWVTGALAAKWRKASQPVPRST
ncbi:MAG: hypothetical protein ACOY3P_04590 [Planctomycetota bacterium]